MFDGDSQLYLWWHVVVADTGGHKRQIHGCLCLDCQIHHEENATCTLLKAVTKGRGPTNIPNYNPYEGGTGANYLC